MSERRRSALTTVELHRLDLACSLLNDAFGPTGTYLVGTAQTGGAFRDVDIRTILDDEEFDRTFGHAPGLWQVFCFTVGCWLAQQTGLPIDYQVQRRTEANQRYPSGPRNPVGTHRRYAGLGDATGFQL